MLLDNYLRKINFLVLPRKYLNGIFICCFMIQMILLANEYIDWQNNMFCPSGAPENQIGIWNDILFYVWLILITFTLLKKRLFLLFVQMLFFVNDEVIDLYAVKKIPLDDAAAFLGEIFYKYYFYDFANQPFIYLERIFTMIIILIFSTLFLCILTVALQVILFLLKEFVMAVIRCIKNNR